METEFFNVTLINLWDINYAQQLLKDKLSYLINMLFTSSLEKMFAMFCL